MHSKSQEVFRYQVSPADTPAAESLENVKDIASMAELRVIIEVMKSRAYERGSVFTGPTYLINPDATFCRSRCPLVAL